ncbi:alpha/beta-hydrolase [Whalleya microplaca]|nr:alpha/beta-hydrolase [Whalleya microplaca]
MRATSALLALAASLHGVSAGPSPGCGKAPTTMTSGRKTITVNNKPRDFIVQLPETYDAEHPYKLIFTFHWLGGSAQEIADGGGPDYPAAYYGLAAVANDSAIFVSPEGQVEGSILGMSGWANVGGEDVAFTDAMIEALEADLCIEQDLRFSMGFSFGAGMSYALACARPEAFRAVAVMSGGLISGCDGGTMPVAYYGQHGSQDTVLPIDGGRQMRDTFVKNNGCTPVSPEPMPDGTKATRVDYEGCAEGYPVTFVVFNGPHTPSAVDAGATAPIAQGNTWEFFSQFS